MTRRKFYLLVGVIAGLLLVTAALAAPAAFSLTWWTVDGGGGISQGGSYSLSGSVGQPDAGVLSAGAYTLTGGFWGGAAAVVHIPATGPVHLPLIQKNFPFVPTPTPIPYFYGPWEVEDNDGSTQANGPLRSGTDYYGYPDDDWDFFYFDLANAGEIAIDLTDHTGQGVQLLLYYQTTDTGSVKRDTSKPYSINYTASELGRYYIGIYTERNHNTDTAYTLHVNYP
jgi:hypothetical protein